MPKVLIQVIVFMFSVTFLYIVLMAPKSGVADCGSRPYRKNSRTSDGEPIPKDCFKTLCSKAATEKECVKYARCTWSNSTCKKKDVQCDDETVDTRKCRDATHCSFEDGKCTWNHELLQSGPKPKIINETSGLNKYCVKRQGNFHEKNLNEYVEDESFARCLQSGKKRSDCERAGRIKLECNHLVGKVYDKATGSCRSLDFTAREVTARPKVPAHEHGAGELRSAHTTGGTGRMSNLFVKRDESILRIYLNSMIIIVVALANVGFANLIRSW